MSWWRKIHKRIFGYKDFYEEYPEYPGRIVHANPEFRNPNGQPVRFLRAVHGNCSGCGVSETTWCKDDCSRLDPMDYR